MHEQARFLVVPPRTLLAVGAISLLLAVTMSPSSTAAEPRDDVSAITLVEQRLVDIRNSQPIALSPDGESIAVSRPTGPQPTELCIHDVATLAERVCADVSGLGAGLWVDSVVWSPDSEWLAFAELWPMFFVDGDLWLMEASSGDLTNLLDDGYDGVLGAASEPTWEGLITLPMYPTFTPDSAAVTFSLTSVEEDGIKGGDIATVPITGGDAVTLGDSQRDELIGEYRRMRWAADGSALYVSLVEVQESGLGSDSGIWVFAADGRPAQQLLGVTGPDDWPPRIVAVSPRGEQLLVLDPTTLGRFAPSHALVDGISGAVDPVEALQPSRRRSTPITGAMLSPDGSLLLTVSGRGEKQVAVRDVVGSSEAVQLTESSTGAPSDLSGEILTWAENDSVLISGGRRGRGTLLVLDRGD